MTSTGQLAGAGRFLFRAISSQMESSDDSEIVVKQNLREYRAQKWEPVLRQNDAVKQKLAAR
ncbi:hypothetical protein OOT33_10930 [Sphingobium sp. DEHP117]|uniref:hypothetical protein n=1 Tax=Sphingobium sp. DEHP117 TaxID=2993436 RepID=UPI0027D551BC|nr:hypothetical protein [Sphingobium sp. DEHP117]MDQ4420944.1 hypothetical protein [Sphingobium sp. DEHP117]